MSGVGAQPVIYVNVDIAFALNFVTDFAWLSATASLAGLRPRWRRLGAAAAVGAVLGVWAYFESGRWLMTLPGALVGTVALLGLAFWPCRRALALRAGAYFIFSGGVMAGLVLLAGRPDSGLPWGGVHEFPSTLVAAGLLICWVGARYLWAAARERVQLARGVYGLQVRMGQNTVELPALLDTGNGLKDPLSGAPIVVAEAWALEALVPASVREAAAAGWNGLDRLPGSWAARCRLVPFRAVGRPAGVLLAFAPDGLAIRAPGQADWVEGRGLIGLAAERLHPEGVYQALLSPQLLGPLGEERGITWEDETG